MWPMLSWAENILDEFAFLILGIFIFLRFPKSVFFSFVGEGGTEERRWPVTTGPECQANVIVVVMCVPSLLIAPHLPCTPEAESTRLPATLQNLPRKSLNEITHGSSMGGFSPGRLPGD